MSASASHSDLFWEDYKTIVGRLLPPLAGVSGWEARDLGGDWESRVLLRNGQLLFISGASAEPDIYGGGRTREDFVALTKTFGVEWNWSTLDEEESEPDT